MGRISPVLINAVLVAFLLLPQLCHAAYVYGSIYSSDNKKLENVSLKIKGENFSYYLVSEKANYSLRLPDGRYDISAEYYGVDGEVAYSATENLFLSGNDARLDLVLAAKQKNEFGWLTVILAVAVIFGILLFIYGSRSPRKTEDEYAGIEVPPLPPVPEPGEEPTEAVGKKQALVFGEQKKIPNDTLEMSEDARAVLGEIRKNDGRITQKELKEALRFADSKISLILAELENEGYVKKFKKGRGNIIILKMKKIRKPPQ